MDHVDQFFYLLRFTENHERSDHFADFDQLSTISV